MNQDDESNSLTEVKASITILDILDIDDTNSLFKLFYSLELWWIDLNLEGWFRLIDLNK